MNKQINIKTKLWSVSISTLLVFILQIGLVKGQDHDPNMGIIPGPASIKKGTGMAWQGHCFQSIYDSTWCNRAKNRNKSFRTL